MKKLFLPLLLLASGIALLVLNGSSTWRFPRAEAASYVMTALGGVWLVIALLRGVTAVKPEVGCTVKFWGPDGRTKLEGRIVEKGAKDFVVETAQGRYTLVEAHFLTVRSAV